MKGILWIPHKKKWDTGHAIPIDIGLGIDFMEQLESTYKIDGLDVHAYYLDSNRKVVFTPSEFLFHKWKREYTKRKDTTEPPTA